MSVQVTLYVRCEAERSGDLAEAIADLLPAWGGGSVSVQSRIERQAAPKVPQIVGSNKIQSRDQAAAPEDIEGYAE